MENSEPRSADGISKRGGGSAEGPSGTLASSSIWPKHPWRILFGAVVVVAVTAATFSIDCPLASWCMADRCPGEVARFLKVIEPFGNGLGVLVIALAAYQLDPRRRPRLVRLLTMSLGGGLLADGVKMLVVRIRPREFSFNGGVAETFGQWFPMLTQGSAGQSFPSAHTATAVGLAIGLAWLYPRGRWLFATLAVLVACQRIESGFHFASDTVVGGTVGIVVAVACLNNGRLVHWFERIEAYLAARQAQASDLDDADVASLEAEPVQVNPERCEDRSRPLAA